MFFIPVSPEAHELQNAQGEKSIFLPEKENQDWKIELFQGAEGKISVGEKIHFKKSDKRDARFANEKLIVTEYPPNNPT